MAISFGSVEPNFLNRTGGSLYRDSQCWFCWYVPWYDPGTGLKFPDDRGKLFVRAEICS